MIVPIKQWAVATQTHTHTTSLQPCPSSPSVSQRRPTVCLASQGPLTCLLKNSGSSWPSPPTQTHNRHDPIFHQSLLLDTDAQENVMQRGSEAHSRSVAVASMARVHKGNIATEGLICMTCSNSIYCTLPGLCIRIVCRQQGNQKHPGPAWHE